MSGMSEIVEAFGGVRPLARAIGLEHTPATVQYWKNQGFLPRTRGAEIEGALCAIGMPPRKAKKLVQRAILGSEHVA